MGERDLLGNCLDGNVNWDLSLKHTVYQLPWFYRGKKSEVSPDLFPFLSIGCRDAGPELFLTSGV